MEEKNTMIHRPDEIDKFINILTNKDKVNYEIKSFNVALNGRWGDGKTTFLNQLLEHIQQNNSNGKIKYENMFTINAWDYDFLDDPSEMFYHFLEENENNGEQEKNKFLSKIYNVLKKCATEYMIDKFNLLKIINNVLKTEQQEVILKQQKIDKKQKQLLSVLELKKKIETAAADLNDNIYIFIDDLDRCNPNFVIKLIELTKHIFDIKNITIIYMLDWDNTNTSIMNHYGLVIKDDDNEKYLSKIIDYKWDLPHLSKDEYLYDKYLKNTFIWQVPETFLNYSKYLNNITFRESEKITIKYKMCVNQFSIDFNFMCGLGNNDCQKAYIMLFSLSLFKLANSKKQELPIIGTIPSQELFDIVTNVNRNILSKTDIQNDERLISIKDSSQEMIYFIFELINKITN